MKTTRRAASDALKIATEYEINRLRDLAAYGPQTRCDTDARLEGIGVIEDYDETGAVDLGECCYRPDGHLWILDPGVLPKSAL